MNDFFSKVEGFLFDILGLILPGAIFLLLLLSPGLFIDMNKIQGVAGTSVILSAITTTWNILKTYWGSNPKSVLLIVTISAYLIGHTVKVFSRIKYEFLTAFFDKGLDRPVARLYQKLKNRIFPSSKEQPSRVYQQLKDFFSPFRNFIWSIFSFDTIDYSKGNEKIKQNCIEELNIRINTEIPDDNYSIIKISSVITNQENLRSLGTFYLAKYNLYRSLALIFLFTTCYYCYFFRVADGLLSPVSREISGIILVSPIILWYTFHSKYKRYWTLYGDERLMTLFYFLNKKKINER